MWEILITADARVGGNSWVYPIKGALLPRQVSGGNCTASIDASVDSQPCGSLFGDVRLSEFHPPFRSASTLVVAGSAPLSPVPRRSYLPSSHSSSPRHSETRRVSSATPRCEEIWDHRQSPPPHGRAFSGWPPEGDSEDKEGGASRSESKDV